MTTPWSTTSRTKKRLSDDAYHLPLGMLALLGLFVTLAMSLRINSLSWEYGIVPSQIPLLGSADRFLDLGRESRFIASEENKKNEIVYEIGPETPMFLLASDRLILGNLQSFTQDFYQIKDKWELPHLDGAPRLDLLSSALERWRERREMMFGEKPHPVALLLPEHQWPVAVIVQVMAFLRENVGFDEIILLNGME